MIEDPWTVCAIQVVHFPFERVHVWRVVFEATHMNRTCFERAAARLRHAGFKRVSGGLGAAQSTWHHFDSTEENWGAAPGWGRPGITIG